MRSIITSLEDNRMAWSQFYRLALGSLGNLSDILYMASVFKNQHKRQIVYHSYLFIFFPIHQTTPKTLQYQYNWTQFNSTQFNSIQLLHSNNSNQFLVFNKIFKSFSSFNLPQLSIFLSTYNYRILSILFSKWLSEIFRWVVLTHIFERFI